MPPEPGRERRHNSGVRPEGSLHGPATAHSPCTGDLASGQLSVVQDRENVPTGNLQGQTCFLHAPKMVMSMCSAQNCTRRCSVRKDEVTSFYCPYHHLHDTQHWSGLDLYCINL